MEQFTLLFDPLATHHISQPLVGFCLLAQAKQLRFTCKYMNTSSLFGHNQLVIAKRHDGASIVFDTHDFGKLHIQNEAFDAAMRENTVIAYFRRSHKPRYYDCLRTSALQHPLGLNYHVSCPQNPYHRLAAVSPEMLKNAERRHIFLRKCLARLPFGALSDRQFYPAQFEQPAEHPQDASVLFQTRTWFPLEEHDPDCDPRRVDTILQKHPHLTPILAMDETRAALIRLLRKEYGAAAIAGFSRNRFALAMYPDLVFPQNQTKRRTYLQSMKRARVCLTTVGLAQSTGWKCGEYVAAAKAIVSERVLDVLPGDFAAERHYLPFANPEEAMRQTALLWDDPAKRAEMQACNAAYYQAYLHPAKMIARALLEAED
ncbi:MAG: hypothetical protein LBB67_05825 [Oscillospiraceae bacterium]|jgi:hypothetical protein|nr:hypothetical protein [Oscillospiraceae bacterium]